MSKMLLAVLGCLALTGCPDQSGTSTKGEEKVLTAHDKRAQNTTNPSEICLSNYGHSLPCSQQLRPKSDNNQQRWALIRNELLPVND